MSSTEKFCIFINTVYSGPAPSVRDEAGGAFLFETRSEAEREIIDTLLTRVQEFLDGEREFNDAITVEEYVVEVEVAPNGSVVPPTPCDPWGFIEK